MSPAARRRVRALPLLLLVLDLTLWTLGQGGAVMRADLGSKRARNQVAEWAAAGTGWSAEEWLAARAAMQTALQVTPDDPFLHDLLAHLHVTQGLLAWDDPAQREASFSQALGHHGASLRLRPGDGPTWSQLTVTLYALGRPPAEIQQAWQQARRFAPREAPTQLALADLAFATWDTATPDMREWVLQAYAQALPGTQAAMREDAKRRGRADLLP